MELLLRFYGDIEKILTCGPGHNKHGYAEKCKCDELQGGNNSKQ